MNEVRENRGKELSWGKSAPDRESMFMQGWHAVETGFKYFFTFTYKTQSIYHRPGIPLYVNFMLTFLILATSPGTLIILTVKGNWSIDKLGKLPIVTKLMSSKTWTLIQAVWLQSLWFDLWAPLTHSRASGTGEVWSLPEGEMGATGETWTEDRGTTGTFFQKIPTCKHAFMFMYVCVHVPVLYLCAPLAVKM